jgi:hypothetical protein
MIPDALEDLLRKKAFARLATIGSDGAGRCA